MSRNQNRIVKLVAALGVFGSIMIFSVPMASAQFSDSSYSGRYACAIAFDEDSLTAVYKYNPNGAGGYAGGTLIGSLNNFAFPFDTGAPAGQFCTFFLQTASSAYSVDSTGVGFETLAWSPSAANSVDCPGAFVDETAIAIRNILQNGASVRAVVADRNLFGSPNNPGVGDAGHGTCVK